MRFRSYVNVDIAKTAVIVAAAFVITDAVLRSLIDLIATFFDQILNLYGVGYLLFSLGDVVSPFLQIAFVLIAAYVGARNGISDHAQSE